MKHRLLSTIGVLAAMTPMAAFATEENAPGLPGYGELDATWQPIDGYLLDTVSRSLPESYQVGANFLDVENNPNLLLNEDARVSVSFISEGAGFRNAFGYFNYDADILGEQYFGDLDLDGSGNIGVDEIYGADGVHSMGIIFPNASGSGGFAGRGGNLDTGTTMALYAQDGPVGVSNQVASLAGGGLDGLQIESDPLFDGGTVFDAGSSVGFFTIANGWNGSDVRSWDTGQNMDTFWSIDGLNPEADKLSAIGVAESASRHVAMLNVVETGDVIMGFEDLNRYSGDNDFNDVVFIIHSDPATAINRDNIAPVSAAPGPMLGGGMASIFGVIAFLVMRRSPKSTATGC